jgi:hypothetical protein
MPCPRPAILRGVVEEAGRHGIAPGRIAKTVARPGASLRTLRDEFYWVTVSKGMLAPPGTNWPRGHDGQAGRAEPHRGGAARLTREQRAMPGKQQPLPAEGVEAALRLHLAECEQDRDAAVRQLVGCSRGMASIKIG